MSRHRALSVLALVAAAAVFSGLLALGTWQLQRLAWKGELIAAIEARAFGEPVAAPRGDVDPAAEVYRRVRVSGRFLHGRTRFVKAVTELGAGYWVMTPLEGGARTVWVNRGFVTNERRAAGSYDEPAPPVGVIGLLRVTEPGGTLLQANDPAAARWYSRDVEALSRDAGVEAESGWFVDAARDAPASVPAWPRAGLTRLEFRNPHLAYALTWYAMALGLALGVGYVVHLERRSGAAP